MTVGFALGWFETLPGSWLVLSPLAVALECWDEARDAWEWRDVWCHV